MIQYFHAFPSNGPEKHVPFSPFPTAARPLSKVLRICFPTLHEVHKFRFEVLQGRVFEAIQMCPLLLNPLEYLRIHSSIENPQEFFTRHENQPPKVLHPQKRREQELFLR